MNKKKYSVLSRLSSLLLAIIIIFNSSISVNAYDISRSDKIYTIYNRDNGENGFFYVIGDDGSKEVLYCYNENLKQPSSNGTGGYKKYDYFSDYISTVSTEIKSEIAAILYAGYPNDALGYMSDFNTSEYYARTYTQDAIWSLTTGHDHTNSNISKNSYINALYFYAEKENGTYGYSGNVSIDEEIVLNKIDGVWKSNNITVKGNYTGPISFNKMPQNIAIYKVDTNQEVTSLNVGDSFYIVYSEELVGKLSETLSYNYETTEVSFYKSADSSYQDMIGLKVNSNEANISISAESENKELPSKDINATVTINKFEENTTNRVIGALLRLYEGTSDKGKLIKEWTTTEQAEVIEVEAGKTYTLVEVSAPAGYKLAAPITFTVEKNSVVTSTSTNIIEDTTDYVAFRLDDGMKHISNGVEESVVYCINKDLSNPEYSPTKLPSLTDTNYPHYRHWTLSGVSDDNLYENQTENFKREQLAEVLLAGYPYDFYGYKTKHKLSDSTAYVTTQMLLDEVLAGKTSYKNTNGLTGDLLAQFSYFNDLLSSYLSPKIDNSLIVVDFFSWVDGTGKEGKEYQNLVGITPFSNNISMEVTMEDAIDDSVSISVEKVWEDNNSVTRPTEIEVQLYRDAKSYGEIVKLNDANNWRHQWDNLDSIYEWTVDEVNIPEGYTKNVINNGTSFTITNTKIKGKLEIIKTDVADGKLLPNAGFRIYDENYNLIAEGRTDENGVVTFELSYGKYYYQEFDAPEGYAIDDKLYPFEIKTNGEIVKANMTNKKLEIDTEQIEQPKDENDNTDNNSSENTNNATDNNVNNNTNIFNNMLPNTGGTNTYIHLILALIITLAGFTLINFRYKNEK